ncbi:alpha/beta fold hydrolase [Balneatrix alpica]|uniref:alpha/beta fold hydrolase n=1 Tax=Balneatrix alpica TaxID=75684 RepID=UPI002738D5D8|nr:alpha/beta fold hydrolase [Balneatrix alpica]
MDKQPSELVVCLHAALSSKSQWQALVLKEDLPWQTLALDLAGHGAEPAKLQGYSLDWELERLRQQVPAERVHLVGHSFGAVVALHWACRYPEQVASLWLYEPVAFYLLQPGSEEYQQLQSFGQRLQELAEVQDWPAAAAWFVDYWQGGPSFAYLPEPARRLLSSQMPQVMAQARELWQPRSALQLRMPVQLVSGRYSPTVLHRVEEALGNCCSQLSQQQVEAGHMGPLLQPQRVLPELERWLQLQLQAS